MRKILIPSALSTVIVAFNPFSSWGSSCPEFEKGRQAYNQKDYLLAIRQFELASRKQGSDPNLHYYLANARTFIGDFAEAKKQYQKCIQLAPSSEAARLARVGLVGVTAPLSAVYCSPESANSSTAAQTTVDHQSVEQFVQTVNEQLSDRKRLAMDESSGLSYNQMTLGQVNTWRQYPPVARHRHCNWVNPNSAPIYESNYFGYGGLRNDRYRYGLGAYQGYGLELPNFYQGRGFSPSYWGSRSARYDPFNYLAQAKALAFEQAAAGLESQMLYNTGGAKINPRGTNLYVRNYGSGVVPDYQPPVVVELLARQEKLVIDDLPSKPLKGAVLRRGATYAAQGEL